MGAREHPHNKRAAKRVVILSMMGAAAIIAGCGQLLGLSNDDDTPTAAPPTTDAATAATAETSPNDEDLEAGALHACGVDLEQSFEDFQTIDALVAAGTWGALVEPPDSGGSLNIVTQPGHWLEATQVAVVMPTRLTSRARIKADGLPVFDVLRCDLDVSLSSWVDLTTLLKVDLRPSDGGSWSDYFVGFGANGNKAVVYFQSTKTDGGPGPENFQYNDATPPTSEWRHMSLTIDLLTLSVAGSVDGFGTALIAEKQLAPPGPLASVSIGVGVAQALLGNHKVLIDNVHCSFRCR